MERYDRRARYLAAALSGLAGYVDAVGFVESKGFFVSFMSGNSTRLGVGMAGPIQDALAAAGLLIAFVLGVAGGSLLGKASGQHRVPAVLAGIASLLSVAAILGSFDFLTGALAVTAFAMGAENASFERQGEVRIGLTYMTGSLVKTGQALANRLAGYGNTDLFTPLLLWGGFILGAVVGATAASRLGLNALWLGSTGAIALAFAAHIISGSLNDDD